MEEVDSPPPPSIFNPSNFLLNFTFSINMWSPKLSFSPLSAFYNNLKGMPQSGFQAEYYSHYIHFKSQIRYLKIKFHNQG